MAEEREISLVIGTAGHIDHGKTALVKALTGVDCDRLMEEKRRGITIELGFAPLRLDDGRVVSVIDVPGHERFIRQMAAGAAGIDAAMLVVAADEGVMPQTREHLAILELLGIRDGLTVITKSDRTEPGMLELVEEDARGFLKGTFLEGKKMIPVSALTGHNVDALKTELAALVDRVTPRPREGAFFLPIDRAFPISGFGTVVTGTAYRGAARPGDEVEILPAGWEKKSRETKIRNLQVHGRAVQEAYAGQRVAVNLSNVATDSLSRGDVVCRKGVYADTSCADVLLRLLPAPETPALKHWQRVRVCLGTSDILARVSLLEGRRVSPGGAEIPAQLVFEEPVVCVTEQRFILRSYSPLVTIGGGRVVHPYGHKPRGAGARGVVLNRIRALSGAASAQERLAILVAGAGVMDFARAVTALQEPDIAPIAARALKDGVILELKGDRPFYLSPACFQEQEEIMTGALRAYHEARASEAGMPLDGLRAKISALTDGKAARSLLSLLEEKGAVVVENGTARLPDFTPKDDEALRKNSEALFARCKERAFQPPLLDELREELKMTPSAFSLLVQGLKNARRVALLPGGYLLTDEMEDRMMEILRKMDGEITLAAVRDATGSSRKFILPILEYFDSQGYTRRVTDPRGGDVRVLSRKGRSD